MPSKPPIIDSMLRIRSYSYNLLRLFGLDLKTTCYAIASLPHFVKDYLSLRKTISLRDRQVGKSSTFRFGKLYPVFGDSRSESGIARGVYFHQDLFFARLIFADSPSLHLDVGSRIDGFIAHLLSFNQSVMVCDIRPLSSSVSGLSFLQLDMTDPVGMTHLSSQYNSISCLHALEHFGLGRYGDKLDPLGHYKALRNISSLLSDDGVLYLSLPVGRQSRIEFNGQRVLSLTECISMFNESGLQITMFAFVDDEGDFHLVDAPGFIDCENCHGMSTGCGLFVLKKA